MNGNADNQSSKVYETHGRSMAWLFLLFILVLAALIYYFSSIRADLKLLQQVKPFWLIIAAGSQVLTYAISSVIYRSLLQVFPSSAVPSVKALMGASVIALLFNQTIPSAGMSGNAFFLRFLNRYHYGRDQIFAVIIAELLLFYAAIELLMIILFVTCIILFHSFYWIKSVLLAGMIIYTILAAVLLYAGKRKTFPKLIAGLNRIKLFRKIISSVAGHAGESGEIAQTISLYDYYRQHRLAIWRSFLLQLLFIIVDSATLYVLFKGIGHPIAPWIALLALISAQIVSIIPVLPGGLILYEGSMSFFFVQAGIPLALAIVVTMIYRLLSFWFPMPAGAWLYRKWLRVARQ